jgi:hypothetical protein
MAAPVEELIHTLKVGLPVKQAHYTTNLSVKCQLDENFALVSNPDKSRVSGLVMRHDLYGT